MGNPCEQRSDPYLVTGTLIASGGIRREGSSPVVRSIILYAYSSNASILRANSNEFRSSGGNHESSQLKSSKSPALANRQLHVSSKILSLSYRSPQPYPTPESTPSRYSHLPNLRATLTLSPRTPRPPFFDILAHPTFATSTRPPPTRESTPQLSNLHHIYPRT